MADTRWQGMPERKKSWSGTKKSTERSFLWLKELALKIVYHLELKRRKPVTLIQQIVNYVDEEYRNPISIKVISYSFNISAAYLGRLFKQETGEGFSRYLNNLRIEKAKELLVSTNIKANKIALEVGYSDSNYFYNIFKKYTGIYPSEYIELNSKF